MEKNSEAIKVLKPNMDISRDFGHDARVSQQSLYTGCAYSQLEKGRASKRRASHSKGGGWVGALAAQMATNANQETPPSPDPPESRFGHHHHTTTTNTHHHTSPAVAPVRECLCREVRRMV